MTTPTMPKNFVAFGIAVLECPGCRETHALVATALEGGKVPLCAECESRVRFDLPLRYPLPTK